MTSHRDVLQAVGPRLRALRVKRHRTLADVSEATGISVSTLSRLETGLRRPTLELLLPLAEAYRVQLDVLVNAPVTPDRTLPRSSTSSAARASGCTSGRNRG